MANVSDFILDRLSEGGIRRIFGYPGDGINGLMGALDQAGDRFDSITSACAMRKCLPSWPAPMPNSQAR